MALVRRGLAAACIAIAVSIAVTQVHDAIATPGRGLDFGPIRAAAQALLHGRSVYANPRFVYPPSAAVAMLATAIGARAAAVDTWLALCAASVALAGILSMAPWRRGVWPLAGALAAVLMLKSDALTNSLWIGNVSAVLAPVAVGVLLAFEAGRWRGGSALLVVSLLVKPLLAPLILLPLLRGQWRAAGGALLGGAVALAASILLVPGGGHFFAVLHFLLAGGTLNGRAAVYNVSIAGLAARLGAVAWGSAARVAVVALSVWLVASWARRPLRPGGVAAIGTLMLLATWLAGSLSEDHYLLVAAPCLLTAVALQRRVAPLAAALPGLVLFAFPARYVGNLAGTPAGLQARYVLAELLLAAAAAVAVLPSAGARPHRRRHRAGAMIARD